MGKNGPCCHCGVESTPLWRNGPPEKPILCNACGSRWRTKGSLLNYTPLHSRGDPDNYEDRRLMRMKNISISLKKKKDEKLNKRKLNYENITFGKDGDFTTDYNHGYQMSIYEYTSNRSSSGSAISNSESCAQFGYADVSDLTDPAQSIIWDAPIPSRKRTCVTRPKQSSVEKLTKDLYTIFHEQASQFSGLSEEDLLIEMETPMEGHGSVLIRHPSSIVKEEESEASSLSFDNNNKLCKADESYSYSNAASMLSVNGGKSVNHSFSRVKKLNGQNMQLEQLKRDKFNYQKFQVTSDHKSSLSYIDLTEILNLNVFQGYLTEEEQQGLLKYLPNVDTSKGFDSLESMFNSGSFEENLSSFQQMVSEGSLEKSFQGVKSEDCKVLMRFALSNTSKFRSVEHYNMLKHKGAEKIPEERFSESEANGKRFRESINNLGPENCTMKGPKRVFLKVDYKRKAPMQNEASYFTPPTDGSSLMVDSIQFEDGISDDDDLLLDVPSNGSFPQAELLCPTFSFASQASSSSIHPKP